jgi:hypothetical protein
MGGVWPRRGSVELETIFFTTGLVINYTVHNGGVLGFSLPGFVITRLGRECNAHTKGLQKPERRMQRGGGSICSFTCFFIAPNIGGLRAWFSTPINSTSSLFSFHLWWPPWPPLSGRCQQNKTRCTASVFPSIRVRMGFVQRR